MSADQQPTRRPPAPPAGSAQWAAAHWAPTSAAEPRRRRWPWIVALLVVVVLMAVAWIAGEQVARGLIERTIREQAITRLDLAADHEIDVDLPGSVLLPLLAGSISSVRVASDDIPLGDASGDIVVEAKDVPVFGDGDWSGAYATVTLDEPQLQRLLSSIDGFPAATVEIDAPDLAATFEIDALLARVPVGVALTPRAQGGDLVLTPTTFRVAGAEVSADAVLRQFGAIASTVVRDWEVCIADRLPAAVTLTDARVERGTVVARFEIDSAILREGAAREKGSCD
jgi:hypothetical protein